MLKTYILIPYGIIIRDDRLRDYIGVDERAINEWLHEEYDLKRVEITKENLWILQYIQDLYSNQD